MMVSTYQKAMRDYEGIVLGIGPISINCVVAAIEASRSTEAPIILIASRRQVDMAELGGGYVNNWTTESFSGYVRARTHGAPVFLGRDHGGPWQNEIECIRGDNETQAMASAKASYEADILAGFDVLHLDPNKASAGSAFASYLVFTERTKELYAHCHAFAQRHGRTVAFEVATDEGEIGQAPADQTAEFIRDILAFCKSERLPPPDTVVLQTGTKVMETSNVGPLDDWIRKTGRLPDNHPLPALAAYCHANGLRVKEHNVDYLSEDGLRWHSRHLIDSINIAPEFGVVETRAFLEAIDNCSRPDLRDRFIELVLKSGKWKKWMLPGSTASDREKAEIAGHYTFSQPEFLEIKAEISRACAARGQDLDVWLLAAVSRRILHYLNIFQIGKSVRPRATSLLRDERQDDDSPHSADVDPA